MLKKILKYKVCLACNDGRWTTWEIQSRDNLTVSVTGSVKNGFEKAIPGSNIQAKSNTAVLKKKPECHNQDLISLSYTTEQQLTTPVSAQVKQHWSKSMSKQPPTLQAQASRKMTRFASRIKWEIQGHRWGYLPCYPNFRLSARHLTEHIKKQTDKQQCRLKWNGALKMKVQYLSKNVIV